MEEAPQIPTCSFCGQRRDFNIMSCSHLICDACKPKNTMACPNSDQGIIAPTKTQKITDQSEKVYNLAASCQVYWHHEDLKSTLAQETTILNDLIEAARTDLRKKLRRQVRSSGLTEPSLRVSTVPTHDIVISLLVPDSGDRIQVPHDPNQPYRELRLTSVFQKVRCSCGFERLGTVRLTAEGSNTGFFQWTCPTCRKQFNKDIDLCAECLFQPSRHQELRK